MVHVTSHRVYISAYDVDRVNGQTVLKETLELLPKPNYNLLKYIRYGIIMYICTYVHAMNCIIRHLVRM